MVLETLYPNLQLLLEREQPGTSRHVRECIMKLRNGELRKCRCLIPILLVPFACFITHALVEMLNDRCGKKMSDASTPYNFSLPGRDVAPQLECVPFSCKGHRQLLPPVRNHPVRELPIADSGCRVRFFLLYSLKNYDVYKLDALITRLTTITTEPLVEMQKSTQQHVFLHSPGAFRRFLGQVMVPMQCAPSSFDQTSHNTS